MEDTLNHLKFLNVLSPRGVHIPNCDKKGFYKKKQVSGLPRMVFPLLSPGALWELASLLISRELNGCGTLPTFCPLF